MIEAAIRSRETVVPPGTMLLDEQAELKKLQEWQRDQPLLKPRESYYKHTFLWPGYNPELDDLADGWPTADAMLNLIAYSFPLDLARSAVLYKTPDVTPRVSDPDDKQFSASEKEVAKKFAEECQHLLENIRNPETSVKQSLRSVLWNMLDAPHQGYSCQEKFWRVEEQGKMKGKWVLRRLVSRHPQDFGFDLDQDTLEVRHLTRRQSPGSLLNGQTRVFRPLASAMQESDRHIPIEKFLLYTFHPWKGLPYGRGHFRSCYAPSHFISVMYRLWGRAQEKTGIPFPSGVSNSTNPDTLEAQRDLLDTQMQGSAVVFPAGFQAAWVNATQGVSDGFEKAVMHQKGEILHKILFQNLTTSSDGKAAYALGEIHAATQEYALAYVRHDVEELVQTLLEDYIRYNYGPQWLYLTPVFSLGLWGLAELKLLADILDIYLKNGVLNWKADNATVRQMAKFKPVQDKDLLDTLPFGVQKNPEPQPAPAGAK